MQDLPALATLILKHTGGRLQRQYRGSSQQPATARLSERERPGMGKTAVPVYIARMPFLPRPFRPLAVLLALAAVLSPVAAEEFSCGGLFIDMPSGFLPAEGDGKTQFSYFSPDGEIELDILIRSPGQYSSVEEMAAEMLRKLGSEGQSTGFIYEGRAAVIAELSFTAGDAPRGGYAVFIQEASGGGCALFAHSRASRLEAAADFIMSSLDACSIDRAARLSPGPVSQFLLPWPPPRPDRKTAALPGGPVELPWSAEEAQQELYTVQREYRILTTYLADSTHWRDAWARFYRMVYRESSARLDGFAKAFARTLPRSDPTESARRVLAWVQGFTFERDLQGLDFVPPLAAAFERRGDCDSRALVMAIILERLGIDCVLMLSREYSHAMLAVDVPGGGQRFPFKGRQYLVAETTARVGLGMIAASQADFSKWLGVRLGE
jgi:hypothetical protein